MRTVMSKRDYLIIRIIDNDGSADQSCTVVHFYLTFDELYCLEEPEKGAFVEGTRKAVEPRIDEIMDLKVKEVLKLDYTTNDGGLLCTYIIRRIS
jgi:hypothetical protein